ncbi:unnamed protein product, partial [Owenia fusiformis]
QTSKIDQANEAGEAFSKLYYENFDKRRQVLGKMYMDTATMVWNGNGVTGTTDILKFIEDLPSSEHKVESLDCQPLGDHVTKGQTSIIVTTMGSVKYEGNTAKMFNQNFMLTSQENVWKVVSDTFRTSE